MKHKDIVQFDPVRLCTVDDTQRRRLADDSLTWKTVTMAQSKESKFFLSGTVSPVSVFRPNSQPKMCIPRMLQHNSRDTVSQSVKQLFFTGHRAPAKYQTKHSQAARRSKRRGEGRLSTAAFIIGFYGRRQEKNKVTLYKQTSILTFTQGHLFSHRITPLKYKYCRLWSGEDGGH